MVCYLDFFVYCPACGILVLQPGIDPTPPAVEAQSLNHCSTQEVLMVWYLSQFWKGASIANILLNLNCFLNYHERLLKTHASNAFYPQVLSSSLQKILF